MSGLSCPITGPMQNNLVLEKIFQFCDVSSLKNIRLVSSKWRDLSLKAWRGKAVLRLGCYPYPKFEEFLKLFDTSDKGSSSLGLKKTPFRRYSLIFKESEPDEDLYSLQKRISEALSDAGIRQAKIAWDSEFFIGFHDYLQSMMNANSLETLEINWETLAQPIPESQELLKCSNMKRLVLFKRLSWADDYANQNVYGYLLKSFPKLEALSVRYKTGRNEVGGMVQLWEREEIAKLLKNLREAGGEDVLALKELEMMKTYSFYNDYEYENERDIIRTLAECKFPLEWLSYHVAWTGEGDMPILPLLKSCKDTLQYFKAAISFNVCYSAENGKCHDDKHSKRDRGIVEPSSRENFSMIVLKEMRIVNGLDWAMFFLAQLELPVLEKLIVELEANLNPYHNKKFDLVSVSIPDEKVFERLETFELHDNPYVSEPENIEKFARMMPKLAHLTIALDKATFPLVCLHFKGLKTLNVLDSYNDYVDIDDESLTGLSKAQLEDAGEGARAPNMTDLKCLTDFRIDCEEQLHRDDVKLTGYSVIHGFLQLPRLFNLSVAIKELSEEMKEKLLNHVKGNIDLQMLPESSSCSSTDEKDLNDEKNSSSESD